MWKYTLRSGSNVANNYRDPQIVGFLWPVIEEVIVSVKSIEKVVGAHYLTRNKTAYVKGRGIVYIFIHLYTHVLRASYVA
jgi:hypothetical protein